MAKKKPETDPTTEQVVDVTSFAESLAAPAFVDDVTSAPEVVEAPSLFHPGEDEQVVTILLPKAVLFALLDPTFEGADERRAVALGLSSPVVDGGLTELGQRVVAGTDTTALRHKIATAWRLKHNAELDATRSKVERA